MGTAGTCRDVAASWFERIKCFRNCSGTWVAGDGRTIVCLFAEADILLTTFRLKRYKSKE